MIQRKRIYNYKSKRQKQRFGKYVKKVQAEVKEKAKVTAKLTSVFKNYLKMKELEYFKRIRSLLCQMKFELEKLGEVPFKPSETIVYTIDFFDIVSKYQDCLEEKKIILLYPNSSIKDSIDIFNGCLGWAGRHSPYEKMNNLPYWNQSRYGEKVTAENVFFGPEIKLKKMPASYWLNLANIKRNKISLQVAYEINGKYKKTKPLWPTEAIVKYGRVNESCMIIRQNLLESIDAILSDDIL